MVTYSSSWGVEVMALRAVVPRLVENGIITRPYWA